LSDTAPSPGDNALAQQLAFQQQLNAAMRATAQAETPQQLAEVLVNALHTPIAICSVWLCGPPQLEVPRYLQLVGIAGQDVPHAVGLGTQIPADDLALLDGGPLHAEHMSPATIQTTPLLRTLLKTCPVTAWRLQALDMPDHRYGIAFYGTNAADGIDAHDLRLCDELWPVMTTRVALYALHNTRTVRQREHTAVLNTIQDAVLIAYPTPIGLEVAVVNEHFRQLFNWRHPAKVGTSLSSLLNQMQIPPTVRQRLHQIWLSLEVEAAPSTSQGGEFEMVTTDGKPASIVWHSVPIIGAEADNVLAWSFVFRNVAPERAAGQVRSAFLTRVSHELRTPLTAINGFAELILSEAGEALPDNAQEYVKIIYNSSQKLKHIFSDLIEITRAYAGETDLTMTQVHLPEVVASAVRSCDPIIKAKALSASLDIAEALPPVWADSERVRRVVSHLVTNAVQSTPEGGQIHVTMYLEADPHNLPDGAPPDTMLPAVVVSIIDDGNGIAPEDAEHVFEPFYRGPLATHNTQLADGVGMGLALSRSFIELHRGKIWAQPNHDGASGGRVFFTLPVDLTLI
jgi:signal transduction histidine kinase